MDYDIMIASLFTHILYSILSLLKTGSEITSLFVKVSQNINKYVF